MGKFNFKKYGIMTRGIILGLALILMCSGCSANIKTEKSTDLAGKTIEIGQKFNVSFDVLNQESIKTEFTLIPLHKQLTIGYVDGGEGGIEVYLYDTQYEEYIQSNEIAEKGREIVFSNLAGDRSYYIEVKRAGISGNGVKSLVLSISG